MIIDEAHYFKEGDGAKVLPPILEKVVDIADNMKLLLLSAKPSVHLPSLIVGSLSLIHI